MYTRIRVGGSTRFLTAYIYIYIILVYVYFYFFNTRIRKCRIRRVTT